MTFKVIFVDGKYSKVLYSNNLPHCDSTARFIVWRNECAYTETTVKTTADEKVYTITVK